MKHEHEHETWSMSNGKHETWAHETWKEWNINMDSMKHEHEPWSMNIKHGNMGMKH
jgi:hypothetical protein